LNVVNGSAVPLSLKFGVWAIRKLRNRAGLDAPRVLDLLLAETTLGRRMRIEDHAIIGETQSVALVRCDAARS